MDSAELLNQLADIHLPEPVGLWPPAAGWWILAVLLLAGLYFGGRKAIAFWRRRRFCAHALMELDRIYDEYATDEAGDPDAARLHYVNALNSVLRRVALVHFPNSAVASLGGKDWLRFLRASGNCMNLDRELAAALSHGRFQPTISVDADSLHVFGREWIRSMYLRRRSGSRPQRNQTTGGLKVSGSDA
ncbi:MAG: DUF4381 domain-containing protein [Gammaproteobacteria bacterium]|nr:DUF4381 domain-containing protein [Gammaproteobacteria bacterium]MYE28821.1 DUF4381 domain-containing protein [Gammaproteobacteria bacterium]MYF00227.1 DUF4381 domain-containing protein [Gammaproteobacteria bacterium]MYI02258.1 DUF4381 domain-containing protein [Gammaproteobacteria bacterium]